MKAKEYFQKYFADLPVEVTWNQFAEVTTKCFQEFIHEQKQVLGSVNKVETKLTKIKEFYKKWEALGPMLAKKFADIPQDYIRDIEQGGNQNIDHKDVFIVSRVFDGFLKEQDSEIHALVTGVKADRRYLPQEERPTSFNPFDQMDFMAMARAMFYSNRR